MPHRLPLRIRQELEEFGHRFVFVLRLAAHHPQRRTANDGVLRSAGNVGVVRQRRDREFEFGVLLDRAIGCRRRGQHRAFAAEEFCLGLGLAPRVREVALFRPVLHVADVLDLQWPVEYESRIVAGETVFLGRERHVVPGGETFELHPRLPRGREAARRRTRRLDLRRGGHDFGPRRRRAVGIEPGLLERVLVVKKHCGRTVERERQHLPPGIGVVTRHRRDVDLRIEFFTGVRHHLVNRLDRALGRHHCRRTDLEHLQNCRRATGAVGGNRGGHRFGITPLEHRVDLVLVLAFVELLGEVVDAVIVSTGHRMPELDFCNRLRRSGSAEQRDRDSEAPETGNVRHGIPPWGNGQSASVELQFYVNSGANL